MSPQSTDERFDELSRQMAQLLYHVGEVRRSNQRLESLSSQISRSVELLGGEMLRHRFRLEVCFKEYYQGIDQRFEQFDVRIGHLEAAALGE